MRTILTATAGDSEAVPQSASGLLTGSVPRVAPKATAREILSSLQGHDFDTVTDIVVTEERALLGVIPLTSLLRAPPETKAAELMDPDPPVLAPGTDQEQVAWKAIQHGELSVVVVDEEGNFLGIVPPQRLLSVLLQEHEEDLARLSGFTRSSRSARLATSENVPQRLLHRAPWLVVGLVGAMSAAAIVGRFEDQISRNVALAFFVPAVVYMADAVGTQTETLIVRGLSLDLSVSRIAARELLTGVLLGFMVAVLAVPAAALFWGDWGAAVTLGLALGAACSTATVVALTLPALLKRLGFDPAYGSGPLATVVQDILSILIYFSIATLVGA